MVLLFVFTSFDPLSVTHLSLQGGGRVPPATNSADPAGFYDSGSVDIPLDSAAVCEMF